MRNTNLAYNLNVVTPWVFFIFYLYSITVLLAHISGLAAYKISTVISSEHDTTAAPLSLPFKLSVVEGSLFWVNSEFDIDKRSINPMNSLGILIPNFSSDISVYINGFPLRLHNDLYRVRHQYRPIYLDIPKSYLRTGKNSVQLQLKANRPEIILAPFYLGPGYLLQPSYRLLTLWNDELMDVAYYLSILLFIFSGFLWLSRVKAYEYAWAMIAFLCYTYFLERFVKTTEPINSQIFMWTYLLARDIGFFAIAVYIRVYLCGFTFKYEKLILLWFGIVFSLAYLFLYYGRFDMTLRLFIFGSMPAELFIGLLLMLSIFYRMRTADYPAYLHWFLAASVLGIVLGTHDYLRFSGFQIPWILNQFIAQYTIFFVLIGFSCVILHRYSSALISSEELNIVLERELEKKSLELETLLERQIQDQKRMTLIEERKRILSDMHDGVGGQLSALLEASRNQQFKSNNNDILVTELEKIIGDLRIIMDSMSSEGENLVFALAKLRERYQRLFRLNQIDISWQIDDDIEALILPTSIIINILRIIQEAFHNVIKHSQAKAAILSVEKKSLSKFDQEVVIKIQDKGKGLTSQKENYGFQTMRQRAKQIGGKLNIHSTDQGLTITLFFSIPPKNLG